MKMRMRIEPLSKALKDDLKVDGRIILERFLQLEGADSSGTE
jgi:hypothetical protein